jgi:antitoxin (DNA-binding transcriptional repressor) of toxin-antitoxin stability system
MHEAKTHLSRLGEEVAAGAPFVICKAGRPLVCVTPLDTGDSPALPLRRLGLLAGQCQVPDDFDRRLLAQASADGLQQITADQQLAQYPAPVRLMFPSSCRSR